jgi:DNA-binding response OmpR family regulator
VGINLQTTKTLLVDDNETSLDLMAQILMGFRVKQTKSCSSAAAAREFVGSTAFDLIIIDAEMPDEDGIGLTRHVRRNRDLPNFTTPIILVSANTPRAKILSARDAGANMVVKKPVAPAILLSRIEWLARNTREFVTTDSYSGPDRRLKNLPLSDGVEERRSDAIALTATPDRAMSQDDVDSLFG